MSNFFKDKIVLITGAASGIGRETANLFASQGAFIVVSDIQKDAGLETVKEIEAAGGKAEFQFCNVAKYDEVAALINGTVERNGRLDIAINNAGIGDLPQKTAETSLESWDRVMGVNASGVFYCMKEETKQMMLQGSGIIVNVSSVAGLRALPNHLPYVASKHAVIGMTKTAALEYAKHNIRVNAVCPVFTRTALFNPEVINQWTPGMADQLKSFIPMKRFGEVKEVADAILWLCSEGSSFVTGLALSIDGGMTA